MDKQVKKKEEHVWRVVWQRPHQGCERQDPGHPGHPQLLECTHCGIKKEGAYADMDGAYYVYELPSGKTKERWAHALQPTCDDPENS